MRASVNLGRVPQISKRVRDTRAKEEERRKERNGERSTFPSLRLPTPFFVFVSFLSFLFSVHTNSLFFCRLFSSSLNSSLFLKTTRRRRVPGSDWAVIMTKNSLLLFKRLGSRVTLCRVQKNWLEYGFLFFNEVSVRVEESWSPDRVLVPTDRKATERDVQMWTYAYLVLIRLE